MKWIEKLRNGDKVRIVLFGTCFSADNLRPNPVAIELQKYLDKEYPGQVEILVRGQGAMNSRWGVENIDSRVLRENPDVCFLEFSANDAKEQQVHHHYDGVPINESLTNVRQICLKLVEQNVEPVYMITTPIITKGRDRTVGQFHRGHYVQMRQDSIPCLNFYDEVFADLTEEEEKLILTEDKGHVTRYGAAKYVVPYLVDKMVI